MLKTGDLKLTPKQAAKRILRHYLVDQARGAVVGTWYPDGTEREYAQVAEQLEKLRARILKGVLKEGDSAEVSEEDDA